MSPTAQATTSSRAMLLFALGAAPLPLATVLAAVGAYLAPVSKSVDAWVQVAFAVGVPALIISFASAGWLASRAKTRPLAALLSWGLGLCVSAPLCILVTALMIGVLGSLHR